MMYNITLQLNARLQPMHRGDIYEDPIHDMLEEAGIGETTGGGTSMGANKEVQYCDVEIALKNNEKETMDKLLQIIDEIGVPKGSFLKAQEVNMPVGRLEGFVLYMNGTELPDEVYQTCDINYAIEQISNLLEGKGQFMSYNEHLNDTALYFYGTSFDEMTSIIKPFLDEYPLCAKCRVEQIA